MANRFIGLATRDPEDFERRYYLEDPSPLRAGLEYFRRGRCVHRPMPYSCWKSHFRMPLLAHMGLVLSPEEARETSVHHCATAAWKEICRRKPQYRDAIAYMLDRFYGADAPSAYLDGIAQRNAIGPVTRHAPQRSSSGRIRTWSAASHVIDDSDDSDDDTHNAPSVAGNTTPTGALGVTGGVDNENVVVIGTLPVRPAGFRTSSTRSSALSPRPTDAIQVFDNLIVESEVSPTGSIDFLFQSMFSESIATDPASSSAAHTTSSTLPQHTRSDEGPARKVRRLLYQVLDAVTEMEHESKQDKATIAQLQHYKTMYENEMAKQATHNPLFLNMVRRQGCMIPMCENDPTKGCKQCHKAICAECHAQVTKRREVEVNYGPNYFTSHMDIRVQCPHCRAAPFELYDLQVDQAHVAK